MNIQQLEYIIAVDNYRHFSKAAEASFVTQPTLSMMIQKLEDELGVKIFDRSQLPVQPTEIGFKVINQARLALAQVNQIKEIIQEQVAAGRSVIMSTHQMYQVQALCDRIVLIDHGQSVLYGRVDEIRLRHYSVSSGLAVRPCMSALPMVSAATSASSGLALTSASKCGSRARKPWSV